MGWLRFALLPKWTTSMISLGSILKHHKFWRRSERLSVRFGSHSEVYLLARHIRCPLKSNATGPVTVDITAPSGVKASAKDDGMLQETKVTRKKQMVGPDDFE